MTVARPKRRSPATTAARKGRPSLEQAERLADDIIDHATQLFIDQGYGATTVEAIAEAAQVSKKTFYTRFPDKAAVFEAAVLRYVRRNLRQAPPQEDAGLALEERLYAMAVRLLDWILMPDVLGIYRVTVAEATRFPELARVVAEFAIDDATRAFEPVFREHAATALDDDTIAFVARQFMQSVAAGLFHRAVQGLEAPGLDQPKREQLRLAVRLFLRGFPAR